MGTGDGKILLILVIEIEDFDVVALLLFFFSLKKATAILNLILHIFKTKCNVSRNLLFLSR